MTTVDSGWTKRREGKPVGVVRGENGGDDGVLWCFMVFFGFFFAEGEPWVIIGYDRGDIWLEYRVEGCITSSLGGWFIYGFVREGLSSFF